MINAALYATAVLIWGTTWFAITLQLGIVPAQVSVAYRFGLSALILFGWCLASGKSLRLTAREHAFVALFGVFQFGGNYILIYLASGHLPSGLVSVVFSVIVFWNILNGVLFFHRKVEPRVVLGAVLGLLGIATAFWHDVSRFDLSSRGTVGLLLCLAGAFCASVGNMVSARNQKAGIGVVQGNAWGMFYGTLATVAVILATGTPFRFDPSLRYLGALAYLALFGSVIAFGAFLTLVGRIGPERASYSSVMFPVIALALSTVYEGYAWTSQAILGALLVLLGNVVVLVKFRWPGAPPSPAQA